MNMSTSTVKDIAQLAGVSTATVSRVLNGSPRTSERVRHAVMDAVSTLQYIPNQHAKQLGRTNSGKKRSHRRIVQPPAVFKQVIPSMVPPAQRALRDENTDLKRMIVLLKSEIRGLRGI
jgi:DNA-binding LacI/PurR family transcriptional regulator